EVERTEKRLAGLDVAPLAHDLAVLVVASGKEQELVLREAERPDVAAARRDDDALHEAEPAAERDPLRRRQGLAGLVEDRDRPAAVAREPGLVLRVHRRAEGAALHPAAGETGRDRGERLPVRVELGGVALPERVLALPADREVVADPEVALAVEH